MFTFRQKIALTFAGFFFLFVLLLSFYAYYFVNQLAERAMNDRASELISRIKDAETNEQLVARLKAQKGIIFFRVGVISNDYKVLYDSHVKNLLGTEFDPEFIISHPEVEKAFQIGKGFLEGYSQLFHQQFTYFAKAFDFQRKTYVLRLAFPSQYIQEVTENVKLVFILTATLVLLAFSFITWLIINHLTKPIHQIISAIKPYQEGTVDLIPPISLTSQNASTEFCNLAKTMNSLSLRIRNQISAQKEFIANASHELKTPITIIKGFSETLHDNPQLPENVIQEITGKMVKNCNRMTSLIKDLLLLSDVENPIHFHREACNLANLCQHCADIVQEIYPEADIQIEKMENKIEILGDKNLLELALVNLIENAAKYSNKPASIYLQVKQNQEKILLSVVDQGIGIPPSDLERIFDRFFTVDKARSRKMGGSGLGLSIAQTIVKKHGGVIDVVSKIEKGTTFTIQFPLKN